MTRSGHGRTWVKRIFSRPVQGSLQEAAPAVPLVIQEWVEVRVQTATEQSNAAASVAREQQEMHLAAAIEEVVARTSAQIASISADTQASAEQSNAAAFVAREQQEMHLAAAIEEVAARTSADTQASLNSARENTELRVQTAIYQATSQAEQGVAALGSALKGVAKVLASLKRDVEIATASGRQDAMAAVASKQEAEAAIHAVEADLVAMQNALESRFSGHDAELNSVAAGIGSAVSDYNAQLRSVEKRVEFVRQEIMYELQASIIRVSGNRHDDNDQTIARIVNPEKVEKMQATGLRLNIGCGHIQHDDYINVDARELPGVDVIAQAVDLPFAGGEIQEISSAHLVEHFSSHVLNRVLLPYWKNLLEPGGQLTTVAPDGAAMLAAVNDGTMSIDDFREVLFGAQDYDGDFHYNLITPDSFRDALARAGFVGIDTVYTEKKNGKCFEFKTTARKP